MSAAISCDMAVTGELIDHATVRHLPVDGSHIVPVLCFDVRILGSVAHTIAHVQQGFALGEEAACEHRAKELRRGVQVTIKAPLVGVELVMHNATAVHIVQPATTEPAREAVPA